MKIISGCAPKTCSLDALPTTLLNEEIVLKEVLPTINTNINLSLASGVVPSVFKSAQVTPLLKKSGLDIYDYKNYHPVSNIPFLSKVMERVVAAQLSQNIYQNNFMMTYSQHIASNAALRQLR